MTMSTTAQTTLTMAYDNALRPATYTAANTTSGTIQSASYVYNSDGLIKSVGNTAAPEFDQSSKYDFAGRIRSNSAGPLLQYMQYDAFSNLTKRENYFWNFTDTFEAGYTNNRKT